MFFMPSRTKSMPWRRITERWTSNPVSAVTTTTDQARVTDRDEIVHLNFIHISRWRRSFAVILFIGGLAGKLEGEIEFL
jgi:hypothetical protein